MGDTSILARRLKNGHVQFGWSGNGGYCRNTGVRLLLWYQEPEDVEYLFNLGQTGLIGEKGSEKGGHEWYKTHDLIGEDFWMDTTERMIFSKMMFPDYGYFFDVDEKWYYIIPGPFRIKIPLLHIYNNLDESGYEFDYLKILEDRILKYILFEYPEENHEFREYLEEQKCDPVKIAETVTEEGKANIYLFYDKYKNNFRWFDDWILLKTSEEYDQITEIVVRKKEKEHIETFEW